jgi:UDP-N-acetylglucosamine 2-epimerase (non-hydrolysing)
MVAFIAGTTAELIKLGPVMRELQECHEPPTLWWTGMHGMVPDDLLEQQLLSGIAIRTLHAPARTAPLTQASATGRWLAEVAQAAFVQHRDLAQDLASGPARRPLLLIHGDTITTAVGAGLGRRLKATVGHVEAGLRSHSLRHPFPEELNRRLAGRLADIHFAPTDREVRNLAGRRGVVVNTDGNTAIDALRFALQGTEVAPGDYGLATLHRFELLHDLPRFRETMGWLADTARGRVIRFYAGATDREVLSRAGLIDLFDDHLQLHDKMPHEQFVKVVAAAAFVVTDSGGLQEECAYLGIPTLVHRVHTERHLGIGSNVVLSKFERLVWEEFFADPATLRCPSTLDQHHPTRIITRFLADAGFLNTVK